MGDILSALQITATGFGAAEADAVGPPGAPWTHASTAKGTVCRQVALLGPAAGGYDFQHLCHQESSKAEAVLYFHKEKKGKKKSYERRGCLNPAELQQSVDTTAAQHPP